MREGRDSRIVVGALVAQHVPIIEGSCEVGNGWIATGEEAYVAYLLTRCQSLTARLSLRSFSFGLTKADMEARVRLRSEEGGADRRIWPTIDCARAAYFLHSMPDVRSPVMVEQTSTCMH